MYSHAHYSGSNNYGSSLLGAEPGPRFYHKLAKFGLLNAFGMGIEYTITHAIIITGFPLRYREITDFTKAYLLSPLALLGRGTIWVGKGLYEAADPIPLAEDSGVSDVLLTAGSDLIAAGAVSVIYMLGSHVLDHQNLLIEKTFVDTFVTSVASALVRPLIKDTLNCVADNCCGFWRRSQYVPIVDTANERGGRRRMRLGSYQGDL